VGEKKSGTASLGPSKRTRFHSGYQCLDFFECVGDQLVVYPTPILTVANDPRILENAKVERQARLCSVERIGQLANATLSFTEQLDDLKPGLVGESVEELDCSIGPGVGGDGHGF
jgi:hypothetical protein